jgi:N utilization substance protein A
VLSFHKNRLLFPPRDAVNLVDVINELVEERGLDKNTLNQIICESMLAAYEKKYPSNEFRVDYNKKTGELEISVKKFVVATVEDDEIEISLRKAKTVDPKIEVDQEIWLPFEGGIGRVEILKAKQLIAQKIRIIEAASVYNEFKSREGSVVHGTIHKIERGGALVYIGDTMAFLPKSLTIPGEKIIPGYPIRALLKEVLVEPRQENQLILDRMSPVFLERLFELEIPEIYDNLVEIKKITREAGYKSKVLVQSHDQNVDPVGTCVGIGGARIKPILKEIGGEKIDILPYVADKEELVKMALKPAEVHRVEIGTDGIARVWLSDDQRSLAIGKMGNNIKLAAALTDMNIELVGGNKESQSIFQDNDEDELGE